MRSPEATSYGRSAGYTVGEGVWEALGPQSFAIGLTSYDGASHWITQPDDYYQSVIPNQDPRYSVEELMDAAGHDIAFVNLRTARDQNEWLGGRFVAHALYLIPEEAEWSRALDALLFIRTQEPRRRVSNSPPR
jgi:erythromycin esterase-like protein